MGKRITAMTAALLLAGLAACSSAERAAAPAPTHTVTPASVADSFYAVTRADGNRIEQFSARTGKVIRSIAPATRDGLSVSGLARLSAKALLVTYTTGPAVRSNVNGGDPAPNTCGGELDAMDVTTGAVSVLWRLGRDQRLAAATPSPDGAQIAALTSPCVPSYFNDHLVVRRLSDGATWSIGGQVARCHTLGAPQWTPDGARLLVTFAPPTASRAYTGPDGTCTESGDSSLVAVDANRAQPLITGTVSKAATGCTYQSLTSDGRAFYIVQACGPDTSRLRGPATLVRLDQTLRVTGHWLIGDCTDGNSIAADATKGVMVSAYLFCNPPLAGQTLGEPTTVLDRLQGAALKRITSVSGGVTAFNDLSW